MFASPIGHFLPQMMHRPSHPGSAFDNKDGHVSNIDMTTSITQSHSSKRPKLSLQTSALPITHGKSSTAFVMAGTTLDTQTPTVLNTFNNTYPFDIPHRPSPITAASPRTGRLSTPSRTSSPILSRKEGHPYALNLPFGIKSILRNSPVPTPFRNSTNSASPRNARRVFFPAVKRVSFRADADLEETIQTTRFVLAHSDIDSESEEELERAEQPAVVVQSIITSELAVSDDEEDQDESKESPLRPDLSSSLTYSRKRKSPTSSSFPRQIQAAALRDQLPVSTSTVSVATNPLSISVSTTTSSTSITTGSTSTSTSTSTNKSSRRKRRRWEWTLAPLNEVVAVASPLPLPLLSPAQIALPDSPGEEEGLL